MTRVPDVPAMAASTARRATLETGLARADRAWLSRLITRRERPERFADALTRQKDDIKVVIEFAEA